MRTWLEHSGIELEARFYDGNDAPTLPESVYWRLDCVTTGAVLQDWTQVIAETVVDDFGSITEVKVLIELSGTLNGIQDRANHREEKHLLVVAGLNGDREYSEAYKYMISRTQGRA